MAGYTDPPGTVEHRDLRHPVMAWGESITRVGIRRPKGRDLRRLKGDQMGDALVLIELCCGLPRDAVDDLDIDDVTILSEVLGGFTGPGRETGQSA
jgi:hypothetical protein